MKINLRLTTLALLVGSIGGIAHAQGQNQLSWSVKSNLKSFVSYSGSSFYGVSSLAQMSLSSAVQAASTEEDFKELW